MIVPGWFPDLLLGIGLVMATIATILYARVGRDQIRALPESAPQ